MGDRAEYELHKAKEELAAKDVTIAELKSALIHYGWHNEKCDYLKDTIPCTCGFESICERFSL